MLDAIGWFIREALGGASPSREPSPANLRAAAVLERSRARNATIPDTETLSRQVRRRGERLAAKQKARDARDAKRAARRGR